MTNDAIDTRRVALDLLLRIGKGSPLDEAFATDPGRTSLAALEMRDRAYVRRLVTITLRHLGEIDHVIDRCLDRPLPERMDRRHNLLRLGVGQLLFADTPAHAAVDTMVRLERHPRMRGFVNAVLRRVAREGATLLASLDAPRLNTPGWLWDSWSAAYGADTARAMAEAHLIEPPLDLTLKDRSTEALLTWAQRLDAVVLPWGSLRCRQRGTIEALPGFAEGAWWVQDAAAALPVDLLGDVAGQQIFDLCAAPGGKTAQLAARGALVTAIDRSPTRLARLQENLARLKLTATTICADATMWPPRGAEHRLADAILLDAPCTATGTLRRRPDAALHKTQEDATRLARIQDALVDKAIGMLKPGGVLVYSTCSLQPDEGEARIARALAQHAGLQRRAVTPAEIAGQSRFITSLGDLRTLPSELSGEGGLDGFYAARLVYEPV